MPPAMSSAGATTTRSANGSGSSSSGATAVAIRGGPPSAPVWLRTMEYGKSFGVGSAFAVGWTPCIGPVLGAIIFSTLQIKLLSIPALRDSFLFIYGGLLILVILYEPDGLVGVGRRLVALAASAFRTDRRIPDAG